MDQEIEIEWSGLRWLDFGPPKSLSGQKMEIQITRPLGTIIIRDFPIPRDHDTLAGFLDEAAECVRSLKGYMRPIAPPEIPK